MKTAIIGRGNVGTHLLNAFGSTGLHEVEQINPHTLEEMTDDFDVAIIAVSDSAAAEVAASLAVRHPGFRGITAHTAGSLPLGIIPATLRRGVIYPMQTFTKGVDLDYSGIPFFVEGDSPATEETLARLAGSVSRSVHHADSAQRERLHTASVLVCNLTNHLYALADRMLHADGLDISILLPLIEETVAKLRKTPPADGQTGPARRGDLNVVRKHLEALDGYPDIREIYGMLSENIYRTYHTDPKEENHEQDRL